MSTTRPLAAAEQLAILEDLGKKRRCQAEINNLRDQVLALFGLLTGFRVTELLRLTVGHVWRHGEFLREVTISRRHLKGGAGAHNRGLRSRTVPLHDSLRALLQTYFELRFGDQAPDPAAPLFPNQRFPDRSISRIQAYRIITDSARRAKIDTSRIATHSLRKAFADEIFRNSGHNLPLLQKALGHRSIITTASYVASSAAEVNQSILGMHGNFPFKLPQVELVKPLPTRQAEPATAG